ncbi:Guard cell S-type anion channel [Nymphaea thermarum]|nr:Guard cell S-type anion channel [Nymphaea thermarum]
MRNKILENSVLEGYEEDDAVDIHQVFPQDLSDEDKPMNFREIPGRDTKKQMGRSFSRQVSLETGFAALKRDRSRARDGRVLLRNGRSFGGFGVNHSGKLSSHEHRKGDFSMFRTKGGLHRQNTLLPVKRENEQDSRKLFSGQQEEGMNMNLPTGRYFAALRGPELDEVKDSEDILLPIDEKWPFLLRFPIGCFGICLGLSSQSILWYAISTSPATRFLHATPLINMALWFLAAISLLLVFSTYTLKCIFYFEAIRREFNHPVRTNFFFAPWIVCMFLAIGVPPALCSQVPPSLWCAFMAPILALELKIYGQWLSGGKRRLCKVVNPSSHLSVIGNFVGAILAAKVGWKEAGKFFWSVGISHYLVVFVTLYQRLPTSETLPKELHPVYSMFIATPCAASIAWEAIYGAFDGFSRICYFLALFLYASLVVRINFFRGFRFSVAWWSYTFPMTTASLATIKYAEQVPSPISKGLAVTLSLLSSAMVSALLILTLLHAFLWRSLFPNDVAIAITKKRSNALKSGKLKRRPYDIRQWTRQTPFALVTSSMNRNSKQQQDQGSVFPYVEKNAQQRDQKTSVN